MLWVVARVLVEGQELIEEQELVEGQELAQERDQELLRGKGSPRCSSGAKAGREVDHAAGGAKAEPGCIREREACERIAPELAELADVGVVSEW